jgi:hypothetical protein
MSSMFGASSQGIGFNMIKNAGKERQVARNFPS